VFSISAERARLPFNHKRVYRIYRELELNLRIKPRRRIRRDKPDPLDVPRQKNQVWSIDFMHDTLAAGKPSVRSTCWMTTTSWARASRSTSVYRQSVLFAVWSGLLNGAVSHRLSAVTMAVRCAVARSRLGRRARESECSLSNLVSRPRMHTLNGSIGQFATSGWICTCSSRSRMRNRRPRNGFGYTITNSRTWPLEASPRNRSWRKPHSSTSDSGYKWGDYTFIVRCGQFMNLSRNRSSLA
jgi:hypothetical protein